MHVDAVRAIAERKQRQLEVRASTSSLCNVSFEIVYLTSLFLMCFRYLVKFLAKLCEKSELNKMSPSNIAIVMGPNLLWPHGESG